MPVQNIEVAQTFSQLADLLEIQGENPFRIRAYRTAAAVLIELPQNVSDIVASHGKLYEVPGIGKDLASKIEEIVQTGHLKVLDDVEAHTPKVLLEMLKLPRMGPKRVKLLYEKLGIQTLEELQQAAESKKILKVKGFGEKTRLEILEGIEKLQKEEKRKWSLYEAEEVAQHLCDYLAQAPGLLKMTVAGSLRRRKEEVADLDIVVTAQNPSAVMDHFLRYERVGKMISKGSTRSTVNLRTGFQVDLRVVADESYGAALLYFTGSKAHNIALRAMAQKRKLKINEYGVFKGDKAVTSATEEGIYELLKLPYIEPELRENRGEVEAAIKGTLPDLIRYKDIRGDLHLYSSASLGKGSINDIALAAQDLGYSYIGISDVAAKLITKTSKRAFLKQIEEIDKLNDQWKDFKILKSLEVEILENGRLEISDEILAMLDYTVCSLKSQLQLETGKQTERILRAMENPHFKILAHPTGKLVGRPAIFKIDVEKVMKTAQQSNKILELNCQPDRMDPADSHCRMAKDLGVKMMISTAAASVEQLTLMKYGIGQARRGWLERDDVVNTLSLAKLLKLLQA
ncbi:DNA polymerase/3'-5' exonuclease PolX [Bdellovibrio bacteriovorus]|uniref:DNA polymerase/3'-5' exonuclease PolX n=1 Tax=Bdellovibrio bacteriovorus TaxID=959 RepID=UPI0035A693CE